MSSWLPPQCDAAACQEIDGVALTSTEWRVWLRDIGVTTWAGPGTADRHVVSGAGVRATGCFLSSSLRPVK
jgi:hypothetical protein